MLPTWNFYFILIKIHIVSFNIFDIGHFYWIHNQFFHGEKPPENSAKSAILVCSKRQTEPREKDFGVLIQLNTSMSWLPADTTAEPAPRCLSGVNQEFCGNQVVLRGVFDRDPTEVKNIDQTWPGWHKSMANGPRPHGSRGQYTYVCYIFLGHIHIFKK